MVKQVADWNKAKERVWTLHGFWFQWNNSNLKWENGRHVHLKIRQENHLKFRQINHGTKANNFNNTNDMNILYSYSLAVIWFVIPVHIHINVIIHKYQRQYSKFDALYFWLFYFFFFFGPTKKREREEQPVAFYMVETKPKHFGNTVKLKWCHACKMVWFETGYDFMLHEIRH